MDRGGERLLLLRASCARGADDGAIGGKRESGLRRGTPRGVGDDGGGGGGATGFHRRWGAVGAAEDRVVLVAHNNRTVRRACIDTQKDCRHALTA